MDDAYILRRYAVNFAAGHGWGFNRGELSFGVTSVSFPILISILLKISSRATYENISYLFGIISFSGVIILVEWWVWRETQRLSLSFLAGTFLAISPMGYMNAVSGMETMTFTFGLIGVLMIYRFWGMKRPLALGLLSGLIFLTRPEGLYLAGAIPGSEILMDLRQRKWEKTSKYAWFALGFAILAIPYTSIIRFYTPGWLPTTYAGKIISADPNMHRFGIIGDLIFGIIYLFKGHWRCMAPYGIAAPLLWAFAAGCGAFILADLMDFRLPISDLNRKSKIINRKSMIGNRQSEIVIWGLLLLAAIAIAIFSRRPETKFLVGIDLIFLFAAWLALLLYLSRRGGSRDAPADRISGLLALIGLTLLPFVYGIAFRTGPIFGGYYNRYILPVLPAIIILSMIGINEILKVMAPPLDLQAASHTRLARQAVAQKWAMIVGFVLLLGYPLYLAAGELPNHRKVYRWETALNDGPRLQAAQWINRNTPPDSVILVGYTGLGVVGGFAERRVLDMGALINPDIFPYYRDVPAMGMVRWKRTLQYIRDKKVDYFVTVPGLIDDPASDPSGEAGFDKATVIDDRNLGGRFSTIVIWHINRSQ